MTKGFTALVLSMILCGLVISGAMATDEPATFSIDWADQPLSVALTTLNKHFGVNYVLPAELGNLRVSANLLNVTPERALRTVVAKAGLLAQLRNGTWMISSPNPTVATPAVYAQMPGMPGMGPGGMMGPNPSNPAGLGRPGTGGTLGVGRDRTSRFGAMTGTSGYQQDQQGPRNYQVVPLKRIDPALVADIFGGSVIWGTSGGGDSGYGSSSSSGYGRSSSSSYGSSDYGSSSSSRSSSRSSSSRSSSRSSSY